MPRVHFVLFLFLSLSLSFSSGADVMRRFVCKLDQLLLRGRRPRLIDHKETSDNGKPGWSCRVASVVGDLFGPRVSFETSRWNATSAAHKITSRVLPLYAAPVIFLAGCLILHAFHDGQPCFRPVALESIKKRIVFRLDCCYWRATGAARNFSNVSAVIFRSIAVKVIGNFKARDCFGSVHPFEQIERGNEIDSPVFWY